MAIESERIFNFDSDTRQNATLPIYYIPSKESTIWNDQSSLILYYHVTFADIKFLM